MARIRTIKPKFWKHPVMARLQPDVQLLALALLSMADDHGYFQADAAIVRGEVMPFRENILSITEGLRKLSEVGWIDVHEHPEQGSIGRIAKWKENQLVSHARVSDLKTYFDSGIATTPAGTSPETIRPDLNRFDLIGNGIEGEGAKPAAPHPRQGDFDDRDRRKLGDAFKEIERTMKLRVGSDQPYTEKQAFADACELAGLSVKRGLEVTERGRKWPEGPEGPEGVAI